MWGFFVAKFDTYEAVNISEAKFSSVGKEKWSKY
jgi:hypothetical protein